MEQHAKHNPLHVVVTGVSHVPCMFHMAFVSHMHDTCDICVLHVICEIWSKPLKSGHLGGSGGPMEHV